MAEREVAGPEVVDDDADAEVAERFERRDGRRRRLEQRGLGDLEAEPRGGHAGLGEGLLDRFHEAGLLDLAGGDVDAQEGVGIHAGPAAGLAARLAQHPPADRQDGAVLLGDLDEFARARRARAPGAASGRALRHRRGRRRGDRRWADRRGAAGRARRRAGVAHPARGGRGWRRACPGSKTANPALPLALAMYIATSALRTTSSAESVAVAGARDADAGAHAHACDR